MSDRPRGEDRGDGGAPRTNRRPNETRRGRELARRAAAVRQARTETSARQSEGASVWLRAARRRADLSQRGLAAEAGVSSSTVARAEARGGSVRIGTLVHLLRACDCRLVLIGPDGEIIDHPLEGLRDRGRRLFPAHLDVFSTAEHPWWGLYRGWLGEREPAPDWSFRLSRDRRDAERRRRSPGRGSRGKGPGSGPRGEGPRRGSQGGGPGSQDGPGGD